MAFYGYYRDDYEYAAADFYSAPYHDSEYSNMSSIPVQDSFSYSSFDEIKDPYSVFTEPESIFYAPKEYDYSSNGFHDYSMNQYEGNYCVYHYTEPNLLQLDPTIYEQGYVSSDTKLTISYSEQEFNAPEFKEYNPHPYAGGYDPITTYGRPLPPTNEICYPRSVPRSDGVPLEGFPLESVSSPYGKDDDHNFSKKPPSKGKETNKKIGVLENDTGVNGGTLQPLPLLPIDDSPHKHDGSGYRSEEKVPQISYGSGLEAVDLCDTIFGYWPCLAKFEKQQQLLRDKCSGICDQVSRRCPWEIAADYLFGSPMVYSSENHNHRHQQQHYQF